jgi:hypothetical protein
MRPIAILVPVLITLAALALALRAADQDVYVLKNGTECNLAGTASSAAGKDLNRHKNRHTAPGEDDIDPEVSLAAMLAPGFDLHRFDQEKGGRVGGFVIRVSPGGKGESCNCGGKAEVDMDTHILLALTEGAAETEQVIVEVTPRLRKQMKDQDVDWSTAALKSKLEGKWVEFTGWMLFDTAHVKEAENTQPGGAHNWRATCWEVHPVTSFKVLGGPPPAAAAVQPAAVRALRRAHADHVRSFAGGLDAINRRNESILSKFSKEEREEFEEESKERREQDR